MPKEDPPETASLGLWSRGRGRRVGSTGTSCHGRERRWCSVTLGHTLPDDHTKTTPHLGIYATAAGLTAAVPFPFVDELLSSLARGAAMRRVAERHDVELSSEARKVLAQPSLELTGGGKRARWIRSAALRFVAPLRIVSRLEDGVTAFVAASLFDHYLSAHKPQGDRLGEAEAKRIHRAIETATVGNVIDTAKRLPRGIFAAVERAAGAFRANDDPRKRIECAADSLLDALADAPDLWHAALVDKFDRALQPDR